VSSTPDPILLLEPANLLEPLDLRDRDIDPANWSARPGPDGTSPKRATRTNRSNPTPPIGRDSRWPVRSALVVAGALACFGAGAAMPQLPNLFGESEHLQTDGSATRPSAPPAAAPVKQAAAPVKSVDSKPAEPERTDPASIGASQKAALGADAGVSAMVNAESDTSSSPVAKSEAAGAATSCNQARPNDDANCLAGGVPAAAKGPAQAAAPNRNSDRSPPSAPAVAITTVPIPAAKPTSTAPATPNAQSAAPQRADTQANGHEEERAPSAAPHSTRQTQRDRATQRDAADQQPAADDAQTSSDRRQDVSRASSRRRDRAARDTIPAASLWGRRQDLDSDRASIWRRDRNDDDGNDDHRVVGRVPREDDRTTGRAPRFGGPLSIFPFPNDW
jgi:hypothetical protein